MQTLIHDVRTSLLSKRDHSPTEATQSTGILDTLLLIAGTAVATFGALLADQFFNLFA